jgi:hypothetical protein
MNRGFDAGLLAGADPLNGNALAGDVAHTTIESFWLHHPCPVCRHTFRIGDEVVVDRDVQHVSDGVRCGVEERETRRHDGVREFFRGLSSTIPPSERAVVRYLQPGDELIAPPVHGFSRSQCAICGHTFRPYDTVVICPCRPERPLCRTAIHHDPSRGMHCWIDWNSQSSHSYCLTTSRKLKP